MPLSRSRSLLLGLVVGIVLSLARAPLAQTLLDGPAQDPFAAALFRALALAALALALVLAARTATAPDVPALAWGTVLGFALHALVRSREIELANAAAAVILCGALLAAARIVGRGERAEPEPMGPGRAPALALCGGGLALSLESTARVLRMFGSGADDERVYGVCLLLAIAIGASAFGGIAAGARGRTTLAAGLALAAGACTLSIALLAALSSRDALDAFLRSALAGLIKLDLSRRSMLDVDLLLGARAFVAPGFLLGVALCGIRGTRELTALLLGAALGLLAAWFLQAECRTLDAEAFGRLPYTTASIGTACAAIGALLIALGERKRFAIVLACVAAALGGAFLLRGQPALPFSPWERFETRPVRIVVCGGELLTVEPTLQRSFVATLARRRITPLPSEEGAEEQRFATAWRALGLPPRGVRVLLVGQLDPIRARLLARLGATRIDCTGAWWPAMSALEEALFEGGARPPGENLSPATVRARLASEPTPPWDALIVPAIEGATFDLPPLRERTPPAVVWQPARAWLADRDFDARGWRPTALLATGGGLGALDDLAFGFASAVGERVTDDAPEKFSLGPRIARPATWRWLGLRIWEREFASLVAAAERLESAEPAGATSPIARALRLHFAAQVHSSPFESPSQAIEIDRAALDLLRESTFAHPPGPFERALWEWFAATLAEKRELELLYSHVDVVATKRAVWPALERALARADLEALEPKSAAERLERVIALEPLDLSLYGPCARAWIAAGEPLRARAVLARALAVQPARRDWLRLDAIASARAGEPQARESITALLAADPDDAELAAYLGTGPWPPFDALPQSDDGRVHDH